MLKRKTLHLKSFHQRIGAAGQNNKAKTFLTQQ